MGCWYLCRRLHDRQRSLHYFLLSSNRGRMESYNQGQMYQQPGCNTRRCLYDDRLGLHYTWTATSVGVETAFAQDQKVPIDHHISARHIVSTLHS